MGDGDDRVYLASRSDWEYLVSDSVPFKNDDADDLVSVVVEADGRECFADIGRGGLTCGSVDTGRRPNVGDELVTSSFCVKKS